MTERELLKPNEVARLLGISTKIIRKHVLAGHLQAIAIGFGDKRPRLAYLRADIDAFINRRRVRTSAETKSSESAANFRSVLTFGRARVSKRLRRPKKSGPRPGPSR